MVSLESPSAVLTSDKMSEYINSPSEMAVVDSKEVKEADKVTGEDTETKGSGNKL